MHISYQTRNKIKKKIYFSKSLLPNKLQRANSFPLFFGMWHFAPLPFSTVAFCHRAFGAFCPTVISRYLTMSCEQRECGIMPQWFLPIYFFWHDFQLFGTIFTPFFYFWHAINPYHQRSYKVPPFRRRKSLPHKELRRREPRLRPRK